MHSSIEKDEQVSPGAPISATSFSSTPPNASPKNHRMSDFGNYRRDLAVLETSGGRIPQINHNPPTATSPQNPVTSWINTNGSPGLPTSAFGESFFDDSSDNLTLSPSFPRNVDLLNEDERRPSVASVATASSGGSKSSMNRGGYRKKLTGFFGDEFPGRN